MKYRRFGRTGWDVSEVGFGAWAIGGKDWGPQRDDDSITALHRALDLGVTFIDTALGYGDGHSEQVISKVLTERGIRLGTGPVRVLTKIPPKPGHWPPNPYDVCEIRYPKDYIRTCVEQSLRNLKAETLDVVLLHLWARSWNKNPVAVEELLSLKDAGKILSVGISNSEIDENSVNDLIRAGMLDAVETVYNIFDQNPAAELLPLAKEHDVAIVARSPLDEGALTGKLTTVTKFPDGDVRNYYFRGDRLEKTVARVEAIRKDVERIAEPAERDMTQVALRFVLRHPAVASVIPGMRNPKQAENNAAASALPPLSEELYETLKRHNWYRVFWLD